jgi:hypothetical protein
MKYAKPEVVLLASALHAIESHNPAKPPPYSMFDADFLATNGAYEADE